MRFTHVNSVAVAHIHGEMNQLKYKMMYELYPMKDVRAGKGEHIDPVCGMYVDESTPFRAEHGGRTYYFCSENCRRKFEGDPGRYAGRGR